MRDLKPKSLKAGPTITFAGRASDEELERIAHQSEAFLFPGEEDFGISPVEAMAAGLPVIAYKSGGALDYVVEGETGVFFEEQTAASLAEAIKKLSSTKFDSGVISKKSEYFSENVFQKQMKQFIEDHKQA